MNRSGLMETGTPLSSAQQQHSFRPVSIWTGAATGARWGDWEQSHISYQLASVSTVKCVVMHSSGTCGGMSWLLDKKPWIKGCTEQQCFYSENGTASGHLLLSRDIWWYLMTAAPLREADGLTVCIPCFDLVQYVSAQKVWASVWKRACLFLSTITKTVFLMCVRWHRFICWSWEDPDGSNFNVLRHSGRGEANTSHVPCSSGTAGTIWCGSTHEKSPDKLLTL